MIPDGAIASYKAGLMRRILRAVEKVEAWTSSGGGPKGGSAWTPSVVRAYVTTAIPPGTKAAPSSSGRARIMGYDGSAWYDLPGDPSQVFNDHAFCSGVSNIAVAKVVKLAWIAGQWWLLAADN